MKLKNEIWQCRIRKTNGSWKVSIPKIGLSADFETFKEAANFKSRFDSLKIRKGSYIHGCRIDARKAFLQIKEDLKDDTVLIGTFHR